MTQVFRMLSPLCRVRMGDWEWESWDNRPIIRYVSVELGEDDRASSTRAEIYDRDFAVAEELLKISFNQGGIEVPHDLLVSQQAIMMTPGTGLAGVATGNGQFVPQDGKYKPGDEPLDLMAQLIVAECVKQGITDVYAICYVLATAQLEAYDDMHARVEEISQAQANADYGGALGNTEPNDGYTYRGRGLVHITGKGHYQTFSKLLGHDIVADPAYAERTDVAIFIMVKGMKDGIFCPAFGKLMDYFGNGKKDYYGARNLVNPRDPKRGDDKAAAWEAKVPAILAAVGGSAAATPAATTAPPVSPVAKPAETAAKPTDTKVATTTASGTTTPPTTPPVVETSKKGTEIIIELGYHPNQMVAYHFIHTGTRMSGRQVDSTVLEGKCIRWLMTRRTKNSAYSGITLKQLAETVCKGYGLKLQMEGDGPTYKHLDQSGISDYDLLLREARAVGYRITDIGDTLILEPYRAHFTGFVISADILNEFSLKDEANKDIPIAKPATTATPPSAESKAVVDKDTGKISAPNDDPTGKATTDKASVTGAATPTLHGSTDKTNTKSTDAAKAPTADDKTPKAETVQSFEQVDPTGQPKEVDAKDAQKKPDNPANRTIVSYLKEKKIPDKVLTNLPDQEVGAVDIADGKAEAKDLKVEANRIKGYQGTVSFKTVPEALSLAPGSIIAIADECFPSCPSVCREWRIEKVKHTFQNGKLETTIDFYTPMGFKVPLNLPTPGTGLVQTGAAQAGAAAPVPPEAVGGFLCPMMPNPGYTSGYGMRESGMHYGIDICDSSLNVVAAADGVVIETENNCVDGDDGCPGGGRCGNYVIIHHNINGKPYTTSYWHLVQGSVTVQANQQVKQGQSIGKSGNTGASRGVHLHFNLFQGHGTWTLSEDPLPYLKPQPPKI